MDKATVCLQYCSLYQIRDQVVSLCWHWHNRCWWIESVLSSIFRSFLRRWKNEMNSAMKFPCRTRWWKYHTSERCESCGESARVPRISHAKRTFFSSLLVLSYNIAKNISRNTRETIFRCFVKLKKKIHSRHGSYVHNNSRNIIQNLYALYKTLNNMWNAVRLFFVLFFIVNLNWVKLRTVSPYNKNSYFLFCGIEIDELVYNSCKENVIDWDDPQVEGNFQYILIFKFWNFAFDMPVNVKTDIYHCVFYFSIVNSYVQYVSRVTIHSSNFSLRIAPVSIALKILYSSFEELAASSSTLILLTIQRIHKSLDSHLHNRKSPSW